MTIPRFARGKFYPKNQEKYVEGIAAIVGDNIILKSDLSQVVSMTALQQRIDPANNPKRFQTLQQEVLQSLIDQKIILEMAELDSIEETLLKSDIGIETSLKIIDGLENRVRKDKFIHTNEIYDFLKDEIKNLSYEGK